MNEQIYLNPVVKKDFPDPFVWKFCGEYWAICTGFWHDGGVFGILRSRDLINWTDCGSAFNPPPFKVSCYWAPEVFYENGKFYLYYSVGNEEVMEIRVAVAESPDGKYLDSGHKLTHEQFAIDAHVFVDSNSSKYLFYATDFFGHSHVGTGTVRDKMTSAFSLEGHPQPVTRAKFDWQIYDPNRASKGGVRWHTIEGSTVLKRKGVYYQMFSGGNWQDISYGVSYATTRDIELDEEWQQIADGKAVFPILRTIPDKVVGPGHNSVVRGPDNFQLYCVYHRWSEDLSERQMAIDKLDFAGERMFVLGASHEPQIVPNKPAVQDCFETQNYADLGQNWENTVEHKWRVDADTAISDSDIEKAQMVCRVAASSFLVEVSTKSIENPTGQGGYGFCLKKSDEIVLRCLILPGSKQIEIFAQDNKEERQMYMLPNNFEPTAFHLWRVAVDNFIVRIQLDEAAFQIEKILRIAPEKFALAAQKMNAGFAGFSLSVGFEELFEWEKTKLNNSFPADSIDDLTARGWQVENVFSKTSGKGELAAWKIQNNFLLFNSLEGATFILKNLLLTDFEFVISVSLSNLKNAESSHGFVLKGEFEETILAIKSDNENHFLHVSNSSAEAKRFALPSGFDPHEFQQFRFRLQGQRLQMQFENFRLGEVPVTAMERQVGLYLNHAEAAFDMIRLTAI